MKELNRLWTLLEHEKPGIKLKDAVERAGLEWYSEAGGGNDELEVFIARMRKYQKRKFIRKILKNKAFQEKFVSGDDFYHLYLLRKTRHIAIEMLFGDDSVFCLLNWEELMKARKRQDTIGLHVSLNDTE